MPWTLWGLAWFLGASATLTTVFPYWMPNRSGFGSIGLLAAACELAAVVHPLVIGSLVAIRIAALALAPSPPAMITPEAPQTGAFLDFEQLVRLQRLMRGARVALAPAFAGHPSAPRVGDHHMPRHAPYAFGGSNALRTWSRDPAAEWVSFPRVRNAPDSALAAVVEFEPASVPQVALVDPDAMRAYLRALERMRASDYTGAIQLLAHADSLQHDDAARVFRGIVAGERGRALLGLGRYEDAERAATIGLELFETNVSAHFTLGAVALLRGDLARAGAHVDSLLRWQPQDVAALRLREGVRQAAAAQR